MALNNLRRRAIGRSPRQPPSTPQEMTSIQLPSIDRYGAPPIPWEDRRHPAFDQDYELAQRLSREFDSIPRDSRGYHIPPPAYEDPFSDDFEQRAFTLGWNDPNPVSETSNYNTPVDYAPVKQEPRDEVLDESNLYPSHRGYMGRSSPFELDSPRIDKSFMDWYPKGEATITYPNEDGDIEILTDVNPDFFEERCPLLAHAFEPSQSGSKLFLEALSPTTAQPFLRFLYTGSYAVPSACGDMYEDVPTSVLLHCQLYRLGDIYDLPELKQQANVNVTRQCEFGCSSPDKPIDLCAAIKYLYEHLSGHTSLIETIICYCVTCFLRHRLAEDFEFRTMSYNLRPFHQDLCKESMKREFEDDTAAAIIQMPFEPYVPETYASRDDVDCVFHFHGADEPESSPKKRKRPEMASMGPGISGISLALRQKQNGEQSAAEETESEEEDLYIGSKRRLSEVPDNKGKTPVYSSDSEYEMVAGPALVQELSSESDSDTDTVVLVERAAGSESRKQALPIRARSSAILPPPVDSVETPDAESGSESDWSLV